ncbi:MAG: hypothetical protein B7X11_03665, partial [Acidobacteria bacterium 37-65-4]
DLAARGDSAHLDLGHNAAALLGSPVVNGTGADAYHLRGDLLTFALTPQHEIRRVLSSGHAAASGAEWQLDADTLDLALDSGKVQRAQAWGHGRRPNAVSGTHTIVADSLDIHMPGQLVRLVWAWGNARMVTRDTLATRAATRTTLARATATRDTVVRDTVSRHAPPTDSGAWGAPASETFTRGALVGDEDWLLGDSLRADFAVRRDSAGARPKSELEHLTSFGSARALYHVESADSARVAGRRGVNYSRGLRIDIATRGSKVETVDVVGQADGVYLEPIPPPPDTTRAAADSAHHAAAGTLQAPKPKP